MTTAEDIKKALEQLSPHDLARFCAWFEEFDSRQFDAAIERDATAGKFDALVDEALAARRYSLDELIAGITRDNRYDEIDL